MANKFKDQFVTSRPVLIGLWVIFAIAIVSFILYSAWLESNSQISNILKLDQTSHFSYLKIELHKLQPREPIVNTTISVYTKDTDQSINKFIGIKIIGQRGYGDHYITLSSRPLGDGLFFSDQNNDTPLFPIKGSHAWFPFDDLEFDTLITMEPPLLLGELELVNGVDGFIISSQPKVERNGQNIALKFRLSRNMFLKVLSTVLAIVSVLFSFFILKLKSTEELTFSTASLFISLWSIRSIIAQGLETFPSLLDFWVLGLFVFLLMGILLKLIYRYTHTN